jgi:hypothetical protein
MGARTVHFFSDRKRFFGASLLFGLIWLVGPFAALCLVAPFVVYQYGRFQAAVLAHRTRRTLVVHSGGAEALSKALVRGNNGCHAVKSFDELASCPEGFFTLVDGSVSVHLVTDDRDQMQTKRFLEWLHVESTTRMRESRAAGWRFNISYTEEGRRRWAFLRLVVSVESVFGEVLPLHISSFICAFGGLCVKDAVQFSESVCVEKGDVLDWMSFYSWFWGCSCCTQRVMESARNRPSTFRLGNVDMFRAALISKEAAKQVYRAWKDDLIARLPFKFFSKEIPFPFFHARALVCPSDCVWFSSTWGDESLLDDTAEPVDAALFVVSSSFRIEATLGFAPHEEWAWELAARFPGKHVVVTHPRSLAEFAFQIGDSSALSFLQSLVPGAAASGSSPHQQWLVQSGLWVRIDRSDTCDNTEEMSKELHGNGFTVIAPHRLIPAPYLNAVRKYHRALRPWLYQFAMEGTEDKRCDKNVLNCCRNTRCKM